MIGEQKGGGKKMGTIANFSGCRGGGAEILRRVGFEKKRFLFSECQGEITRKGSEMRFLFFRLLGDPLYEEGKNKQKRPQVGNRLLINEEIFGVAILRKG